MAWLLSLKPLPKFVPKIETELTSKQLYIMRKSYGLDTNREAFLASGGDVTKQGVHLPKYLFPTSARVVSRHQSLPDMINLAGIGVSGKLKRLIEDIEPGVHQFEEVEVRLNSGEKTSENYFAAIISNRIDGQINFDASTIKMSNLKNGSRIVSPPMPGDQKSIHIWKNSVIGKHIWYSADIYMIITVSDELHKNIIDSRINCFDFIEVTES